MKKILIIVTLLGGLFLIKGLTASEFEGKTIKEIRFQGLVRVEAKNLLSGFFLAQGMVFKDDQAGKDLKNLYSYGYFDNVKLDVVQEGEGLTLTYQVEEKNWITEVKIQGNKEISEQDLLKLLINKPESFYDPFSEKKDREKILEEYSKEGFVGTDINFSVEKKKNDHEVQLLITIKEGEKIFIEVVDIQGVYRQRDEPWLMTINEFVENTKFRSDMGLTEMQAEMRRIIQEKGFTDAQLEEQKDPEKTLFEEDLKKAMEKTQAPWIGRIKTFPYNEMDFLADKEKAIQQAKNRGYIHFKITKSDVQLKVVDEKTGRKGYVISLEVEPGDQYTFGGVELRGNTKIATSELMEYLDMKPGDLYNDSKFMDFYRNAYIEYQSLGFFYSKLTPKDQIDEQKKTISFLFDIYEGDKVHIENIYILGNTKTETLVIDREMRLREGEIYDLSKLLRTRDRLMKTQFFSNAMFEPKTGSEEGLIDLFWKVEEAKTGMLTLGGGWGTLSGFTGFVQVSELNLFGKGYNTSIRGDLGQKRQAVTASFGSGWIGYLPIKYSFSVSYAWQQVDIIPEYDRDGNGVVDKMYDNGDGSGTIIRNENAYGDFDDYSDADYNGNGIAGESADAYDEDRYVKKQTVGFGVGLGYSISEYWNVGANQGVYFSKYYSPYNITVDKIYEDEEYRLKSMLLKSDFELTTKTGFGITYDSSDSPLTPTKGFVFAPGISFYGLQGGYNRYTSYSLDLSGYLTLISSKKNRWNLVWANHIGFETLGKLPFSSQRQLYAENRLSFDGMRELKGWEDYVYEDNMKGLSKISLGSEIRIPIPGTENLLWWAFFFDGGYVDSKDFKFSADPEKWFFSEGFGLKVEIPMFPIRLYFAKRLLWENGWFKEKSGFNFVLSISGFF